MSDAPASEPWRTLQLHADAEPGLSNDERASYYQKASEAAAAAGRTNLAELMRYDHMLFTMRGPSVVVDDRPRFASRYRFDDGSVYPDLGILRRPEPLKYFVARADDVQDAGARASYLDFLWESRGMGVEKPAEYARRAVTAYRAAAADHESRGSYFQASAAYNRALQLVRSIADSPQSLLKEIDDYARRLAADPDTVRYLLEIGEGVAAHAQDFLSEQDRKDWQGWTDQAASKFAAEGGDSRVLERRFLELKSSLSPDVQTRRAIAESFEAESKEKESNSALVAAYFLDAALAKYEGLGDRAKVDQVRVRLEDLQAKGKSEFQTVTAETNIPTQEIDAAVEKLTEGSIVEVFERMAAFFTPSTEQAVELARHETTEAPLLSSLDTEVYSDEVQTFRSDSGSGRVEAAFVRHLQMLYHFRTTVYFEKAIDRIRGSLTGEALRAHLSRVGLFDEGSIEAIVRGYALYEREQAFEAVHVIVPQIEDLFRQVLRAAGRPVTVRNGSGGFRKRSLSTLFEQEIGILRQIFGVAYCNYAYCFFLDSRADNLRNTVAHGLLKPGDSDKTTSHIVFHHVIVLGMLRTTVPGRIYSAKDEGEPN